MPANKQNISRPLFGSSLLLSGLHAGIHFFRTHFSYQVLADSSSSYYNLRYTAARMLLSFFYGRKETFLLAGYWLKIPDHSVNFS